MSNIVLENQVLELSDEAMEAVSGGGAIESTNFIFQVNGSNNIILVANDFPNINPSFLKLFSFDRGDDDGDSDD